MYPGRAAVSAHANAVTEGIKQVLSIWRTLESSEDAPRVSGPPSRSFIPPIDQNNGSDQRRGRVRLRGQIEMTPAASSTNRINV